MLKKAVQQGRSQRRGEAYSLRYVEPLSAARTTLAVLFSIFLSPFDFLALDQNGPFGHDPLPSGQPFQHTNLIR